VLGGKLGYDSKMYVEGLEKTMMYLSHHSWCFGPFLIGFLSSKYLSPCRCIHGLSVRKFAEYFSKKSFVHLYLRLLS